MNEKLTKAEREQRHPLVIMNHNRQFLQGKRWVDEYPDADKFKPTGEVATAKLRAKVNGGKVVADCDLETESVLADFTPKFWLVRSLGGTTFPVGAVNASEISDELPRGTVILRTDRLLYESGQPISDTDTTINDAVRTLIHKMGKQGKSLCLLTNDGEAPYILPALINGAIEYQVSDGIDGDRSTSYDAYTWSEALANFEQMRKEMEKATV